MAARRSGSCRAKRRSAAAGRSWRMARAGMASLPRPSCHASACPCPPQIGSLVSWYHLVAAHVLHGTQRPERHGIEIATMMAQFDRAQREALDRALVAAADNVLADPKRIVEKEEDPRDHVLHERLRAEPD